MIKNLDSLQHEAFKTALEKGWWSDVEDPTLVIPEKIALMHSELSEALEEYRNGHRATEVYYVDNKPEGFPIELADCVIRILDLCESLGINLNNAVNLKMDYNKTRPYRHGGKKI